SIILLTVILRILLHPFNISQAKSMAKMQKVQPEMNAIKAKYKDNPQKMNAEIMELYKKHNMNPFGGCLPMLLQIPILFALFTMLRTSIEIKGASFLWLTDLSKPDVMYILPILIAVSMYYQQKSMQVNQSAPGQSQMMVMMPVMMFVITLSLPSGVLVYWFISNILSYFQQKYVNKHVYGGKK
ncbi:MAG: YidC/Oxa1 family membrane protein insertase, partial [Candidatus Muiribacteriota bacterium]